jgi:hypothetical protein
MYLLQQLPDIKKEDMIFQAFTEGGRSEFNTCLASIERFYGVNSYVLQEWRKWEDKFIPEDDNVETFMKK